MNILNKTKNIFFLEVLAILIIISFLLPIFKIGSSTSVKLDWVFLKIGLVILFLIFDQIRRIALYKKYLILFFFITISSLISNYVSGFYYLKGGHYILPTTIIMILDRITVFIFFSYLIYREWISWKKIKFVIIVVSLLALLFGVFQFFNLMGARDIALSYYLERDGVQEYNFVQFNRVIGTSPAIITWGGVSVLLFHFFYFIVRNSLIRYLGIVLAVINVLVAASRSAIVSLIVSYVLILLVKLIFIDKNLKSFLKIGTSILVLTSLSFFLLQEFMPDQVEFLSKRFEKSEDALSTEGRGVQVGYFTDLITDDAFGAFFGVGPSVINEYGYLEVDYAFIFFGFGVIGFVLHYYIVYLLLKEAYRYRYVNPNLFLFCWGSTIGYLVFSVGFYFFYELYMGMPFWWLNGIVIGYLWLNYKKEKNAKTV